MNVKLNLATCCALTHNDSKIYSEAAYFQKMIPLYFSKTFLLHKTIYSICTTCCICMFYSEVMVGFIQTYLFITLMWLNESSVSIQICKIN